MIWALCLSLILFNSCEEREQFGLDSDDVAPVEFLTEEISIPSSIVVLDSVITDQNGRLMVGRANDTGFGTVNATSYMAVSLNTLFLPDLTENAILDSVKMTFQPLYLYDTASDNRTLGLRVTTIGEEFRDTTYINSSTLLNTNEVIGEGEVEIIDFDSIYSIDLDLSWANVIFDGIRNDEAAFTDQSLFDDFLPGIILSSLESSNNIFGLRPRTEVDLLFYYRDINDSGVEISNVINLDGGILPYFFNITADRSTSQFAEVNQLETEFDGPALRMIQSGSGVVTKLDFSPLEVFANENQENIVNLAEIEIGPIDELPDERTPPIAFFLYITDDRNRLISDNQTFRAIQIDGVNVIGSSQQPTPVALVYDSDTRTYRASITSYIQAYVAGDYRRDDIFLYPIDMTIATSTVLFDPANIKLNIFYSELR